MRLNTPPSSEIDMDEDFDIGEIEEVIEIEDEEHLESVLDEAAMNQDYEDDEEENSIEVTDMAAIVFDKHQKSVFCCALLFDGKLAVTGGEDDMAYVWDTETGNVIFTCDGHKDSVFATEFSFDGKFLATADMSGYIQVWKMETQSKIWECDDTGDLNWIEWHRSCNVLVGGASDGSIWKWLVPQSPEYTHTFGMSGISSQCGKISSSGKHVIAGYEDGSTRVFDLKSGKCIYSVTDMNAHSVSVTSISCHPSNPVYVTSSMDGTVKIYNYEKEKVIGTLDCCVSPDSEGAETNVSHSVEAVSIHPTNHNLIVTSTLAGVVSIWDLSSLVARHHIAQGCGSSHIAWHPTEPIMFTSGLDGTLRSYDTRSGEPLAKFTGHRKSLLSLQLSRDGSCVLTTSDDGSARIFRIKTES